MTIRAPALAGFVLGAGMAASAYAVPITAGSTLSLKGSDSYTATSINFTNPADIGARSGSFEAAGIVNCIGCVTMTSFSAGTATPFQLYTATEGALTTALVVSADAFDFTPGDAMRLPSLAITGTGMLSLTGFDDTPGMFSITTQGPNDDVLVTFSVTSTATGSTTVPEPAPLAILGAGMVALWLGRRRTQL
jgi:uncharacterized protein YaiE (UPF0345 family)